MHQAIATIPGHKSAISDVKFFQAPAARDAERYPLTETPRAFAGMDEFSGAGATGEAKSEGEVKGEEGSVKPETGDVYSAHDSTQPDFPTSGSFLVSSGFDGYVKVWSSDDWQQVRAMANDQAGKVMSVDVSSGASLSLPPSRPLPLDDLILTLNAFLSRSQMHASSLRASTTRRSSSTRTPTSTCRSSRGRGPSVRAARRKRVQQDVLGFLSLFLAERLFERLESVTTRAALQV